MAKRKRLSPLGAEPDEMPVLETKAFFPSYPSGYAGGHTRSAPIADMAGAAAATAAMQEMAETLRAAREGGRLVIALPLDQVEAGHLVRDRLAADPEEMTALIESLRLRGQQTPIEVVALEGGRYGLISGWRRLRALTTLRDEAGDRAQFGTVLALLRKPDQASEAYLAMVEENEIRVGLSFYERARIVAKAVEIGVYASEKDALRDLFRSASRAKRSKIGSFLGIVQALDGVLRFPEAMSERFGLQLAKALEADPQLGPRLRAALAAEPAADAATELARLSGDAAKKTALTAVTETVLVEEPLPGLRLSTHASGRLVLEGVKADAALRARLLDWLKTQEW
ncbi:ParB N-terminal domain-containing protein [Gemmobacter fulvus]|uniref:ParB/RepB/Spo0J family partition protein n=1 Tax=Gemmobacter fulvus TaxID=2840474 RepID=UPI00279661DB|nr:ParB N-terminal domain-containing protein [Gemmobacter fulvus]MDQ1850531.1 ParB N-terminal domain-containing protein [Gemmobacter fulvus]